MVTVVIHYSTSKDPDVYFGITESTERRLLRDLHDKWDITRAPAEDWYGQDIKGYPVHHWNAQKKQT